MFKAKCCITQQVSLAVHGPRLAVQYMWLCHGPCHGSGNECSARSMAAQQALSSKVAQQAASSMHSMLAALAWAVQRQYNSSCSSRVCSEGTTDSTAKQGQIGGQACLRQQHLSVLLQQGLMQQSATGCHRDV